jgi:hypothetical protein
VALADWEESATLVAVIVIDCVVLIEDGAVYKPLERVPTEGLKDQVTEVFALPVTVAANWVLCDAVRVALKGLRLTWTPGAGGGSEIVPEPPLAGIESPAALEATTLLI